jgi:hypothetical protein
MIRHDDDDVRKSIQLRNRSTIDLHKNIVEGTLIYLQHIIMSNNTFYAILVVASEEHL